MDFQKFLNEYGETLKNGIITEACVDDFFDLVLEMDRAEIRSIKSQLRRIYCHMLKYLYQPEKQTRSWITTIRDASRELYGFCNDSKYSWKSIIEEDTIRCYNNAINDASNETGIDKRKFPKQMSDDFKMENVSDNDYIENFLKSNAYSYEAKKTLYMI